MFTNFVISNHQLNNVEAILVKKKKKKTTLCLNLVVHFPPGSKWCESQRTSIAASVIEKKMTILIQQLLCAVVTVGITLMSVSRVSNGEFKLIRMH